ncbi:hypothetical protein [Ahrensia kielensis]|uniref:hypothetical protein n=1 Tax=Ahrensia kielensis TaxID=76980 RepID=UPI00037A0B40|nr:hypothetical protein [Ahrensia kielensis]
MIEVRGKEAGDLNCLANSNACVFLKCPFFFLLLVMCSFCEHSVAKWKCRNAFVLGILEKEKNELFFGFFLEMTFEGLGLRNSRGLSRFS